jgi:hypothetical protein
MPIRINFLAEHQAEQEERRKDPVKRATLVAVVLVALMAFWGGYLQIRLLAARSEVASFDAKFSQISARYNLAQSNDVSRTTAQRKLGLLHQLASARVLWAGGMHALQYAAMDEVSLTALRTEQSYVVTPATAQTTNSAGRVIPAQPARAKEQVTVFLEARDAGLRPGDLISQFQDRVAAQDFFKTNLGEIRLEARSQVQTDLETTGRPFVSFLLKCSFAERER